MNGFWPSTSNLWKQDVLWRRVATFMQQSICLNQKRELKLSTKDLLALASMKNAAKREM
jgi:hypothetical protein